MLQRKISLLLLLTGPISNEKDYVKPRRFDLTADAVVIGEGKKTATANVFPMESVVKKDVLQGSFQASGSYFGANIKMLNKVSL